MSNDPLHEPAQAPAPKRASLRLAPARRAVGTVRLPGSKSISNRALLLAALGSGTTRIEGLLESDDTQVMLAALKTLGVVWRQARGGLEVEGVDGVFPARAAEVFVGNAGTAVRPLTAALALNGGEYRVSGVARMHERPIGDLVDGLRGIGADIDYLGQAGYPPLAIHAPRQIERKGAPLRVRGDVSSQFLSALLMAAPRLCVDSEVVVEVEGELISRPYIEITRAVMARFGVEVEAHGTQQFVLPVGSRYRSPGTFRVEGDASSASYFLAAGALGGGPLRVEGVGHGSVQGDVRFADALNQMGANVMMGEDWIEVRGIDTEDGRLRPLDLDCNLIPDAAMTLAVLALFASGPSVLRNIGSWRVKETDRIAAMCAELSKLGAQIEAGADWLRIEPGAALKSDASIHTYDDHRMAMCFSLVCLGGVPIEINDPDCVAKTFPTYFERFAEVLQP